ncbi:MAG: Crp/Fnr family transcriptional regulator [Pseudomonadota bacterium]
MTVDCQNCPLRDCEGFQPMTDDTVHFMRRFKKGELQAEPGTQIMTQGSSSTHLFTCLEGQGVRYKDLPNGERQVISFVLPGDFIGLQAGVMGEMTHSVEATTEMTLCTFNRSDFWNLFKEQPARGFDITRIAALEECFLGEALAVIGQLKARARVAWALWRFQTRLEEVCEVTDGHVPLPFKQQDLADAVGLSLVHTNKTLARLREDQIATWSDGWLTVHDPERLAAEAAVADCETTPRPLI